MVDKWELQEQIIEVLSNSDLEWMSTKQIFNELANVYNTHVTMQHLRARLNNLANHSDVESRSEGIKGNRTHYWRVLA